MAGPVFLGDISARIRRESETQVQKESNPQLEESEAFSLRRTLHDISKIAL
jgi:hypothetical protein